MNTPRRLFHRHKVADVYGNPFVPIGKGSWVRCACGATRCVDSEIPEWNHWSRRNR